MRGEGFIPVDPKEYKEIMRQEKPTAKQIYRRLLEIEDILGDEYDLDRLRELAQAYREGRVKIVKRPPEGANCGHCADFIREAGTAHGMCRTQKRKRNKNGEFRYVSQSTHACSAFREEAEAALEAQKGAEHERD